jgi:hypothetical protein
MIDKAIAAITQLHKAIAKIGDGHAGLPDGHDRHRVIMSGWSKTKKALLAERL